MTVHILLNSEGYITFSGTDADNLLGYETTELVGTSINNYLYNESQIRVHSFLQRVSFTDSLTLKTQYKSKRNGWKPVEICLTRLPVNVGLGIMVSVKGYRSHEADHPKSLPISNSFFESYPSGVLQIGVDGSVQMINKQLEAEWGHDLGSLQNQQLIDLVHPQYQRSIIKRIVQARSNGESAVLDIPLFNAYKTLVHANVTISPVRYPDKGTTLYLMVKNISDQVQLQNKLKRLSAVADKTTNGVAIVGSDFKIEWANEVFCRTTGYIMSDVIGKHLYTLLCADYDDDLLQTFIEQMATSGKSTEHEIACQRKDGISFWNLAKLTPVFDDAGQLERFITVHDDITEKKKTELDLRMLADDLYKQNKELHQFAYIVSHNLRSPVANILGLTNMLETFKDDEETQSQVLQQLSQSVNNLDAVIKDLSYILTVTDGSREVFKEPVNIQELLQQVLSDMQLAIAESDAQITLPVKKLVIRTNRAYLYSIFFNLISNALKYRSPQSPYVKVDCYNTSEHTVIYVADNGKGIDLKKHAGDLFKPYKRFDFRAEGKGLGLFLVKSHIEAMGGELSVKSELHKGSTFYIKLPIN